MIIPNRTKDTIQAPAWFAVAFLLLLGGLIVRVVASMQHGYGFDVDTYTGWARSAAAFGLVGSYEQQLDSSMLPNYPPFSILILQQVGYLYSFLEWAGVEISPSLSHFLIKLPGNIADMLATGLLFVFVRRWKKSTQAASLAALLYWCNPVVIYNSAYWGQTDSIYVFLVGLALYCLLLERSWAGGIFAALALLAKMQAVIFVPLYICLLIGRRRQLVRFGVGGLVTALVFVVPFIFAGNFGSLLRIYTEAIGFYPYLTFNAYNLWWLLFADSANSKLDQDVLFHLISYRHLGILLFGAIAGGCLVKLLPSLATKERPDRRLVSCFAAAALISYAFFTLTTQMHERYLFPAMLVMIPLLFVDKGLVVAYVAASFAFLMNLLGVLPLSVVDTALFAEFPHWDSAMASIHVAVLVVLTRFVWRQEVSWRSHRSNATESATAPR